MARSATSMPFSRGIAMSRIATSGRCVSHMRSTSSPSPPSPTTSMSFSVSSSALKPRRTMPWSSPSTIRNGVLLAVVSLGHGQRDVDHGPAARRGFDRCSAVDVLHPLLDAGEAEAAMTVRRRHTDTVVAHRHVETGPSAHDLDLYFGRGGMFGAVGQCLLHHTVHARALRIGKAL